MKDYFNRRKSNVAIKREQSELVRFAERKQLSRSGKLLLFTLLTMLVVGASPAGAQKALPYSYGFEEASCSTSGWTKVNCHNSSENYKLGTSGAYKGDYAFRFYYTSNYPQYLISPELATSSYSLNVSFWYKAHSTSYEESFQVGYSTTDAETSSFTFGDEVKTKSTDWQEYSTTCPAGTKYICIACTSNNMYFLYIDDLVVDSDSPYKTPKSFASTGVTATTATFGWTADGNETAWQIAYSSTEGFDVDAATKVDVTTNPYTLEGLTAETTYYARIRADYGSGNYSAWSDEVSFKPTNAIDLTVNDGTTINNHVPFNGNYADTQGTKSQFIIPASSLTAMQGRQIQDMTFYTSTATKDFGNARFDVYMAETSATTFDAATFDWSDMDQVAASATVNIADGKMTITLDEGFNYSGDNLKIGFNLVATGGYTGTSWYGIKVENAAIKYYNGGGATIEYFLPKITFTSMPGVPVAVKKPKSLAASEVGAATATLGWTDGEEGLTEWQIAYSTDADFDPDTEGTKVAANANPFTLTELTASTTYYAYVRAKKGEDYSKWSNKVEFTTTERYPAPAGLAISNLTTTSATLTWTAGEATAWEVAVNTTGETPTEAGTVVNSATYEFTELTAETTYYAFVRTKDGDNYSAWSAACEFLPSANTYLTVNDGTTTNSYVPVYGYFSESANLGGQFIIPAASLTDVQNKVIKKLTFYSATTEYAYGDAEFDVCLKEVSDTYFPSSSMYAWDAEDWTKVYSGTIAIVGGKMNITFTSDFNYAGSNLLVGIHKTSTDKSGSNWNVTFYGNNASSNMSNYSPNGNRQKFQPKTTIGYQEKTGSELKVFDGETELAVSPTSFDFGLAEAGTTHTFTLKNTAATPYVATISSENLTVNPTSVTPTAEGVTFTVAMPAQDITDEAVVITPAAESGLEPFTINVSGTLRNAAKLYVNDFTAQPAGWTADSWSFGAANGASTSKWNLTDNARLKSPMLTVAAGEKFIFEAKGTYESYQHLLLEYSADGTTWTAIGEEVALTSAFQTFTVTTPNDFVAGRYYIALHGSQAAVRMFYGGEEVSGANFAISTDGSEQDFGKVAANATAEKSFTVTNNGNADLTVTLAGTDDFTVAGNTLLFTNNKGWSKVYVHAWNGEGNLTEWPGTEAAYYGKNTNNEDQYVIVVPDGATGILFNNGEGLQTPDITNFNVTGYYLTGDVYDEKYIWADSWGTAPTVQTVAAGESADFTVAMNTATPGSKSGNVTLSFEALNATSFTIPCTGFVKDPNALAVDFEDNAMPENWQVGSNWTVGSASGNYYAVQSATSLANATSLVTAPLTVGEDETLTFKVCRNASGSGYKTLLQIRYSQDGGVNWSKYTTYYNEDDYNYGGSFTTKTVSGIPAGTTIVEFNGCNIRLDDIEGFVKTTAPVLVLTEDNIAVENNSTKDFGNLQNIDGTATYTITNKGNANLVATLAGTNVTVNLASIDLAPGESEEVTVTLPYSGGNATGSLAITSESWVGDVTINYTATLVDASSFVEDFTTQPAGWYFDTWAVANGVAYINQGATKAMITEKIGAEEGKNVLTFDAKMYSDYGTGNQTLNVYTSNDRKTWSEAQTFSLTAASQTFSLSELADGEYYVKFEALNAAIDNIKGVKKLEAPEHDLFEISNTITGTGVPGAEYTATVTAVSLRADESDIIAELWLKKGTEYSYKVAALESQSMTANESKTFTLKGNLPEMDGDGYKMYATVKKSDNAAYFNTDEVDFALAHKAALTINSFTVTTPDVQADDNNEFTATFNIKVTNTGTRDLTAEEVSVSLIDNYSDPENVYTSTWTAANSQTVFLNPGDYTTGANMAIYRWNDNDTDEQKEWALFTEVSTGFYSAELNGKQHFIICRINPATAESDLAWGDNVYNQSSDLSTAEGNIFGYNGYTGDNKLQLTKGTMSTLAKNVSTTLQVTVTGTLADGKNKNLTFYARENLKNTILDNGYTYVTQTATVTAAPVIELYEDVAPDEITTGQNRKVSLSHKFVAGWNTICVPFAISDLSTFGEGAVAFSFDGYDTETKKLTFNKVDALEAAKPYVIYTPADISSALTFTGVTIAKEAAEKAGTSEYSPVTFQGSYRSVVFSELDGDQYGLTAEGMIKKASATATMQGFRAYFTGVPAEARVAFVGFDETQGISNVSVSNAAADGVFDMQGRKVETLRKGGLYIVGGKKQVVK